MLLVARFVRRLTGIGTALLLATAALVPVVFATSAASARAAVGHVRLAHLSPDTPAVDVYLYPFGGSTPKLVLKAVPYGGVSPYERLAVGQYTVAMRPAGAAATTPPVLSANVRVATGRAYTVAGMGPYKSIRLQVLRDSLALPAGKAGLRVIAASLKERVLKVTAGGETIEPSLRFAETPEYRQWPATSQKVTADASDGKSATADVSLAPGSTNTVVVLDGKSGLQLLALRDAAAPGVTPVGAVDTGLGGLAADSTAAIPAVAAGVIAGVIAGVMVGGVLLIRRRRAAAP
ncbi:DUF4397 domain-containing protein [Streptosporangiaceae bacterium NEAU-GS5]|nr:DUF4397 domain-containing protein [Streptosporangiaceae bacterium NEAU-GS5]